MMRAADKVISPPVNLRSISVAVRFRKEIEKAEAAGFARAEMNLHLTRRDAAGLTRDRDIAVADISFVGGVMRYLDVPIVQGGVSESALRCGETLPEAAPRSRSST